MREAGEEGYGLVARREGSIASRQCRKRSALGASPIAPALVWYVVPVVSGLYAASSVGNRSPRGVQRGRKVHRRK